MNVAIKKVRQQQKGYRTPRHGEILGWYVVVWDRHIGRESLIPANRSDILENKDISLP